MSGGAYQPRACRWRSWRARRRSSSADQRSRVGVQRSDRVEPAQRRRDPPQQGAQPDHVGRRAGRPQGPEDRAGTGCTAAGRRRRRRSRPRAAAASSRRGRRRLGAAQAAVHRSPPRAGAALNAARLLASRRDRLGTREAGVCRQASSPRFAAWTAGRLIGTDCRRRPVRTATPHRRPTSSRSALASLRRRLRTAQQTIEAEGRSEGQDIPSAATAASARSLAPGSASALLLTLERVARMYCVCGDRRPRPGCA